MADNNVVDVKVTPRQIEGKVDKHRYVITYDASAKCWRWEAFVSVSYKLTGEHKSPELAEAQAKKKIAKFLKDNEDMSV